MRKNSSSQPSQCLKGLRLHVCLLKRLLYGLKQAPKAWFDRLSQPLLHLGFICSKVGSSLFILHMSTITVLVLVYVDDIIITGNDKDFVNNLITDFGAKFAIKDLGKLHYFLGVAIKYITGRLFLTQTQYVKDLLHRAGITNCSPINTPMALKEKSKPTDDNLVDAHTYRSIVGAL